MTLRDMTNDSQKQTLSNTNELKHALEMLQLHPRRFPPLLYKDTGQYLHVKLTMEEYKSVEELSLDWNLSIRKTVHRLIINRISSFEIDIS